jgi:hypothetical protein
VNAKLGAHSEYQLLLYEQPGIRPLIALARALHVILPDASTQTRVRTRDFKSSISSADMPAIIARTFVPKVLVDHKSSKSRNVLATVISLVSIFSR